MVKDAILSLKSPLIIKENKKLKMKCQYLKTKKRLSILNARYEKERYNFKITNFNMVQMKLTINNKNRIEKLPCEIQHSSFNTYINKYKITNSTLIKNIEEYYRLTKTFIYLFNDKYEETYGKPLNNDNDTIFCILSLIESTLEDTSKYKEEKVDNIITKDMYYRLVTL